jgi:hypothetical protein
MEYNGQKFTVKIISRYSFAKQTIIQHVIIPNTIISIESTAFWQSFSLETVVFVPGSRLQYLSHKSFDCTKLTSIILPGTIKTMEVSTFYYNILLSNVTYCGSNPIQNSIFSTYEPVSTVIVHSGYPISTFGDKNITISDSINCPSIIYQNIYSLYCTNFI